MAQEYRLKERSVLIRGRKTFTRDEVIALLRAVWRKPLRRQMFMRKIDWRSEATFRWNIALWLPAKEEKWVQLQVRRINDEYRVYCSGPHSIRLLSKLNGIPMRRRALDTAENTGRMSRAERRRRQRAAKRAQQKAAEQSKRKKSRTRAVREARGEVSWSPPLQKQLTPMFRHTPMFWQEAVDVVAYALQIQGVWRARQQRFLSGRDLAAVWLLDALEKTRDHEQNVDHYAQIAYRGFYIRLDIVEHKGLRRWRGDPTLVTISCSKMNPYPAYRRLRRRMRMVLLGKPLVVQEARRARALQSDHRFAA